MKIGTITGDTSGVIHVIASTHLDAAQIDSVATSSLSVYSGGYATLPSTLTLPSSPVNFTIRGSYAGLTDLSLSSGAALVLGGSQFALNTLQNFYASTINLVSELHLTLTVPLSFY